MANTRPGNAERGWNDPPVFLYNPNSTNQVATKRTLLNKRVAHNLNQTDSACGEITKKTTPVVAQGRLSTSETSVCNNVLLNPAAGPPVLGTVSLVPPLSAPTPSTNSNVADTDFAESQKVKSVFKPEIKDEINKFKSDVQSSNTDSQGTCVMNWNSLGKELESMDDTDMLELCADFLHDVLQDCSSLIQKRVADDIRRRLDIFKDMWRKGNLSVDVKKRMTQLAKDLQNRNCDAAFEIHLSLMLDYVTEVSQWMVGIKRLIQEARQLPADEGNQNNSDRRNNDNVNGGPENLESNIGECKSLQNIENTVETSCLTNEVSLNETDIKNGDRNKISLENVSEITDNSTPEVTS